MKTLIFILAFSALVTGCGKSDSSGTATPYSLENQYRLVITGDNDGFQTGQILTYPLNLNHNYAAQSGMIAAASQFELDMTGDHFVGFIDVTRTSGSNPLVVTVYKNGVVDYTTTISSNGTTAEFLAP